MAKPSRKDKNAWDRFLLWAEENQKVIWVVLLLILAPTFAMTGLYQQALLPDTDSAVLATVFGHRITIADKKRTDAAVGMVLRVLEEVQRSDFSPLPGPLGSAGLSLRELDVVDFYAYREKALDKGIRVSDAELIEYIHELWQRYEAGERAEKDLLLQPRPNAQDQNAMFQEYFKRVELAKKKLDELRAVGDGKAFDGESWRRLVEGGAGTQRRILLRDFEETLRDICIIAKLENYVKSSVKVSPQEVYDLYNKEKQRRKLSWVELKVPDSLRDPLAKTLTPDELKQHYETEKNAFKKDLAIKTSWLLLPREHFKAEAEKLVTDEDLKKHYMDNRNDYRRPVLLSSELDFAVRNPEEKAAFEAQVFKPLEEVKDKVREKVIETRTLTEMRAFSQKLAQRIYPPKAPAEVSKTVWEKPALAFDDLVKEFPFLKAGISGFVEQKNAKDGFGDAFTTTVDGWFRSTQQKKAITPLRVAIEGEKGQVFYAKPEIREGNYLPHLKDIENDVRESLAKKKVLEAVEKAAKDASKEVNEGKKDFAAAAEAGLDVEVAGVKAHLDAVPVQVAGAFLSKDGPLTVPKQKDDKAAKDKDKKLALPETEDGDDLETAEESHPASSSILEALFRLPDGDKQKTTVVSDEKAGSCYIVRFDDLHLPNPSGFEAQKASFERTLTQRQATEYFAAYRRDLLREARPEAGKVEG